MRVAVITDSAAAIPEDVARRSSVIVVPVWLTVDGRSYRDGELSQQELLRRAAGGVSTSGPSPGDFQAAIAESGADEAVILTVSSAFSATYRSARVAAIDAPIPVRIVDTRTAAPAQGLVVLAAAACASTGAPAEEVERAAREAMDQVYLIATLDDLEHLVRTGRIPGAAGWVGRRVGLNPIVEFRGGSIRPLRPAFSRDSALDRIMARWRSSRAEGALHVVAFHALDEPAAARMLERVRAESEPASAFVADFGAAMVAYTGPGVVGLAWRWERP